MIPCSPRHRLHCSPAHRQLVADYRAARQAWQDAAEAATYGYATELADYAADHPPPTFKQWLQAGQLAPTLAA